MQGWVILSVTHYLVGHDQQNQHIMTTRENALTSGSIYKLLTGHFLMRGTWEFDKLLPSSDQLLGFAVSSGSCYKPWPAVCCFLKIGTYDLCKKDSSDAHWSGRQMWAPKLSDINRKEPQKEKMNLWMKGARQQKSTKSEEIYDSQGYPKSFLTAMTS